MAELLKAPWPGWETVRLIGRGSYGTVYEIQRKLVDGETESAALKVITIPKNPEDVEELYSEGYDSESITATFNSYLKSIVAEYSLMQKMEGSANIVNCKDILYLQHEDGIGWDIFIRMELLTPLMKALSTDVGEATVIRIGKDICNALVLCKKHGVVHRDIKPQNIFVSSNGDYKLGDFGIAKTVEKTMGGTKIGTYKYMAPEVYNNLPYGSAADIYSLGLVLYWLLNQRRMPFMPLPPARLLAGVDEDARQRRLSGEKLPEPANGSAELKRIVMKACAFDQKDRYESAAEMLDDLNRLTGGAAVISAASVSVASTVEAQEDDKTVGPVFGGAEPKNQDSADASDATVGPVFGGAEPREEDCADTADATVGPVFAVEAIPHQKQRTVPSPSVDTQEKNSRRKWKPAHILLVAGAITVVLAALLVGFCRPVRVFIASMFAQQSVSVDGSVIGIIVSTTPTKKTYEVGEELNTKGLTLMVKDSNGEKRTIDSGFECTPTVLDTAGNRKITVTYGGKTTHFYVTVTGSSVDSISINTMPTKTTYYVGEKLNTSGLTLKVRYGKGGSRTIDSGFECTPTVLDTAGAQIITVTFGGKTATFYVTVKKP